MGDRQFLDTNIWIRCLGLRLFYIWHKFTWYLILIFLNEKFIKFITIIIKFIIDISLQTSWTLSQMQWGSLKTGHVVECGCQYSFITTRSWNHKIQNAKDFAIVSKEVDEASSWPMKGRATTYAKAHRLKVVLTGTPSNVMKYLPNIVELKKKLSIDVPTAVIWACEQLTRKPIDPLNYL